ncbi:sensor domain-containing protein [Solimonas soli]|uniref:sensor domain-containing protein n=1 Tax=Solimonas soli TaxID=413479 RepID=UPI0004BAF4D1|nr:EAL domain-containing protein [Solimonas soli]
MLDNAHDVPSTPGPGLGEEERLRLVIEAAPNAMIMVDRHGRMILVNSQTERLFGYPRSELLGQSVEILVPARFREGHHGARRGFFARPDTRSMGAGRDLYGLRKDGSEVPIEIGLNPLTTPEGIFVLASVIDITERKRSEERLRLVIEAAPNAMLMVGSAGGIVLVNSQAERLFGYRREELLQMTIEALIPQRFRTAHRRARGAFFAQPDTRAMGAGRDLYGLRKDGSEVPIEIGLNPLTIDQSQFVLASVIDITERRNAERLQRALQAESLRQAILDSLPFSVIATDTEGRIVSVNPAAGRMLHYQPQELVGQSTLVMHVGAELERRAEELSNQTGLHIPPDFQVIVASGSYDKADEREWTYVRKDGVHLPVNVAITAMRDDAGRVNGFLKVAYDITERRRAEDFIRHMAHHDALTGLPNRTLLNDRLESAIRHALRHGTAVTVLMLDLDHFKRINDTLGHQTGDKLLLQVSQRLQRRLRDTDTVARLGGDEFIVVLPDAGPPDEMQWLAHELMRAISAPMQIDGRELLVTPSIGGALFPRDGLDAGTLLRHADTAMYHAKASGRSSFHWFTESMLEQSQDKLELGSALRRAIHNNELTLVFQPEISLRERRTVGIEALLRWQGPQGDISPDRFVPIAEETGLIVQLGDWVLRRACQECAELQRRTGQPLRVAVNVSPRQFRHKELMRTLRRALLESGLPPACLELEITEGMLMDEPKESAALLLSLRRLGIAIVVDDFGTGYSSLAYLTRFPIDKIKIDRSFVRDLAHDSADAAVVNAIIAMAHSLDIRVIAEGVETEAQERYLLERGCDEVQGFRYSPGVSVDAIEALLTTAPG